jgi:hypothetical protein
LNSETDCNRAALQAVFETLLHVVDLGLSRSAARRVAGGKKR